MAFTSEDRVRAVLHNFKEGVSFQVIKTFKASNDPDYEAKENRVLELYEVADDEAPPGPGDPTVVFCMDEFGPLDLQPHRGKHWAPPAAGEGDTAAPRRRRRRVSGTCSPPTTWARQPGTSRACATRKRRLTRR